MGDITTIGLDLAKSVFQVHAVDEMGSVVMRKRLRRSQVLAFFAEIPPCVIGLEACATAHYWARELIALGHEARLMPPNYVKAYVKRNKHDVADALGQRNRGRNIDARRGPRPVGIGSAGAVMRPRRGPARSAR